jgi:hypothetical protein
MNEHTPGPWKVAGFAGEHDEAGASIVGANGDRVASTWGGLRAASPTSEWRRYHADAELIAAAPELLASLRGIIEIGKRNMSNPKYDGYFTEAMELLSRFK